MFSSILCLHVNISVFVFIFRFILLSSTSSKILRFLLIHFSFHRSSCKMPPSVSCIDTLIYISLFISLSSVILLSLTFTMILQFSLNSSFLSSFAQNVFLCITLRQVITHPFISYFQSRSPSISYVMLRFPFPFLPSRPSLCMVFTRPCICLSFLPSYPYLHARISASFLLPLSVLFSSLHECLWSQLSSFTQLPARPTVSLSVSVYLHVVVWRISAFEYVFVYSSVCLPVFLMHKETQKIIHTHTQQEQ